MTPDDSIALIQQLIGGDPAAAEAILARATTSSEPLILIAAALIDPRTTSLLDRAASASSRPRDRQLVALAQAHLLGDDDLVSALAREHLLDHPDSVLAAWIAAGAARPTPSSDHQAGPTPAPTSKEFS